MNRRQSIYLFTSCILPLTSKATEISDSGDTVLKLLDKYKFQQCKVYFKSKFADLELINLIKLKSGINYRDKLAQTENLFEFVRWEHINFDGKLFITV